MSKVRIRNGPYSGRERTLGDRPLSIGRDAEAGLQILDRSASRFHAEVFPVGGMYFVRDLDSKNGTYVNDDRLVDEELIREGDVIKIGTTELIFESGNALNDEGSSDRIAYHDDADMLSNTLEFRIDDLTDIDDEAHLDRGQNQESRALQILYQVGRVITGAPDRDLAAKVLDYLITSMPAESALVFTRERHSGKLVPLAVRTANTHANPTISRTIIRRTVSENRAFFTANAQEDQRFNRQESTIQKSVTSVVCVPLPMEGHIRGVLYLSRGFADTPFDKADMELLSACALQLGLAFTGINRLRQNRRTLWHSLSAMVRALEHDHDRLGCGDRCARAASAVATALNLSDDVVYQLRVAGLLFELGWRKDPDGRHAIDSFAEVDDFTTIAELVRDCYERLDGSGPRHLEEQDLGIPSRILAAAASFSEAVQDDADTDAGKHIEALLDDSGYDRDVVACMQACHLDGSLYQAVEA